MKKRRVTLNLDEELIQALESFEGRSLSSAANEALHSAVAMTAHRASLLRWLDELDAEHGSASPAEVAIAEALVDQLELASPRLTAP